MFRACKDLDGRHNERTERAGMVIRNSAHWRGVDSFADMWAQLRPLGRHPATGGYRRFSWGAADLECRAWFTGQARARGLGVRADRNGNLWAWWGTPGPGAVATGSHLDSVPDGGAFDGPLGVVSALAAVDRLRERG